MEQSSLKSARYPDLYVVVRPSRLQYGVAIVTHLLAGISLTIIDLAGWIVFFAWFVLVPSLTIILREESRTRFVHWYPNNRVETGFVQANAKPVAQRVSFSGWLMPEFYHAYFFVVLLCRSRNGQKERIVISRDAVSQTDYRRIRARLNCLQSADFAEASRQIDKSA